MASYPSTEEVMTRNLCHALCTYEGSAKQHAMLLSGNKTCSKEAKDHPLYGALPFVSQGVIESMLDLMEQEGVIETVRVKGEKPIVQFTAKGEAMAGTLLS